MTPAQATRLGRIRAESRAGGTRVAARELPSGFVRVTERERGQKPVVSMLGRDGNYIDR